MYVGSCVGMYVLLYKCVYVCMYIHMYVCDPVRLRLRHLYQVEFCSFKVRYPTVGASVYCGHISSIKKVFGAKAKTVLGKQPCCTQRRMYRLYRKNDYKWSFLYLILTFLYNMYPNKNV